MKTFPRQFLLFLAVVLFLSVAAPSSKAEDLSASEQAYFDGSLVSAEAYLKAAAKGARGEEKMKFSRMLARLQSGAIKISLVESEGVCAKEGYGGFVYALNGKPHGNDIYLCKKAMRRLRHDKKEGAQIILHELAHLDGTVSECEATFTSMSVASLAGVNPAINGYFESCWPNGIQLATKDKQEDSGKLVLAGLVGAQERGPSFRSSGVLTESKTRKLASSKHLGGCESAPESISAR